MNTETQDRKEFVIDAKNALQTERRLQSQLVESGGDFVLPDYMPSVQKVLRLEARVLPPTRYVGANNVQMSGDVLHTLIYLGEDGETGATVLPSKYEFSIPTESLSSPNVTACVEVDGLTYRITAPRKLNIRTRLGVKPYCYEKEDITPTQTPPSAAVNRLYGELDGLETVVLHSTDAEVSDRMEIGTSNDARLLWCGATAAVTDARASEGGVSVRGEILAKVLANDGGNIKMYSKKIPFDEFLEGDISHGGAANATAHVISTEAVKESDTEASIEVSLSIEATVDSPVKHAVLKDAFSSDCAAETVYKNVKSMRLCMSKSGIYTVGASIAKSSAGVADSTSVIDTSGRATVDEINAENGKITVLGRCELTSMLAGENEITSADYSVPFNIAIDCDTTGELDTCVSATLVNPRVRIENDNLVCDMDIALALRAVKQNDESILASVDCTSKEKYKSSTHPLCLIYPNGESLWELAKKYHVSPESLASVNALDIDEGEYTDKSALSGVHVLMLELN